MADENHFSNKYDLVGIQPGRIIDFGTQCKGRTLDLSKATITQVEELMEKHPVSRQYFTEKKKQAPISAQTPRRPVSAPRTPESFSK